MKHTTPTYCLTGCLLVAIAASSQTAGAQFIWSGASGSDLNWLTSGNWSPSGPPSATDDARFFDNGATNDVISMDNLVAADMTVKSLGYGQTNGIHNTFIAPGVTLTLAGTGAGNILTAGTETDNGGSQGETNTISGPGAVLSITNPNGIVAVRQGVVSVGSTAALRSTLDLSGLDNFNSTIGRLLVGCEGAFARPAGTLFLARTNVITAGGSSPAIAVGGNGGGSHNSGNASFLYLGQMNTINASSITVGRVKQGTAGGQTSSIRFNPALVGPMAIFRGADGVGRVPAWTLADAESGSGSGTTAGTCDFTGGAVDAMVDVMTLGRQVGSHSPVGTLTFEQGTFDINTLILGEQTQSSTSSGNGIINVNGSANLVVQNNLELTQTVGGSGAASSTATLNINGGTVNVMGTLTHGGGTENINLTGGLLVLPSGSALRADTVTVNGGMITNVDILQALTKLTIGNGGIIANPQVFDMGTSGAAAWDVSGAPGGGLVVSNQFSGAGSFLGDLTMAPGSVCYPGGAGAVNALYLYNNLTLNGATLREDLTDGGFGANDVISVSGNLILGATNFVRISALNKALDTLNPYTLMSYYGTLTGDASNFQTVGSIAQSRYTFTFSTSMPNTVQLIVGGAGAANLLWTGDGVANTWDIKTTTNWNNGSNPDAFYNLDNVVFDDTGSASPAVNLAGTLVPGGIVLSNNTSAYVFAGPGGLGAGSLTNYGTGGLTVRNSGTNSFDVVDVENGNVTFDGGSLNSVAGGMNINTGASVTVANTNANDFGPIINLNGDLTFNQAADANVGSALNGVGNVTKNGGNILTLSGDNSGLYGNLLVNGGTLLAGTAKLLSATANTIASGATLDVNGFNLGLAPVTVSGAGAGGQGAIVNNNGSPGFVGPSLAFVTLAGNTTFGGTGRWDLRSAGGSTGDPSTAGLSTSGNSYDLTKVGTNGVYIVSATVDPMLGNIDIQSGVLSFEGNTTSMGDPAKTLTVEAGATLQLYQTTISWDKHFMLHGDGLVNTINNASGNNTLIGPITLNGSCLFNAGGTSLTNLGPIDGSGSLIKVGGSRLVLASANTYGGATVVSNGTLEVNGSLAGSGVDVEGGTLAGLGSISAPVLVNTNGTLSPGGGSIAPMSIASTLSLAGINHMDLNDTGGALTSDLITNVTTLTLGGTLQLNITGDTALAAGDAFTLYSAGSIMGSFDNIQPAPGTGLSWDTSELASKGILKVATAAPAAPAIGGVSVTGGSLMFTVTGGTAGATAYVLSSTNLAAPLANWTPEATNLFDNTGSFSFTNAVGDQPQQFYIIQQP